MLKLSGEVAKSGQIPQIPNAFAVTSNFSFFPFSSLSFCIIYICIFVYKKVCLNVNRLYTFLAKKSHGFLAVIHLYFVDDFVRRLITQGMIT